MVYIIYYRKNIASIYVNAYNKKRATIRDWQNAETSMWGSTGLPGSLSHNEGEDTEHAIYAVDRNNTPATAEHFVNSADEGEYYDPWNGNTGNTDDLNLQQGRPRRGFDYVPPPPEEETR